MYQMLLDFESLLELSSHSVEAKFSQESFRYTYKKSTSDILFGIWCIDRAKKMKALTEMEQQFERHKKQECSQEHVSCLCSLTKEKTEGKED